MATIWYQSNDLWIRGARIETPDGKIIAGTNNETQSGPILDDLDIINAESAPVFRMKSNWRGAQPHVHGRTVPAIRFSGAIINGAVDRRVRIDGDDVFQTGNNWL